jgi:hypothetical protein
MKMRNGAENRIVLTAKHMAATAIAALMMLTASGAAQAKDDKDDDVKQCSVATLHGVYIFHASGFNIVSVGNGTVAQPKAIVEVIRFDGDGHIVGGKVTVSLNGIILGSPGGGTGTYTVQADCTGEIKFLDGGANPKFDLFIGAKPSQLYMIQTGQTFNAAVFAGTAERVSD